MTQEELAEILGVSVDAVGKYERSLSYIRGDLEHRLAERLGWSREEIVACREDWAARGRTSGTQGYRLLDDSVVDELYAGSWTKAAQASVVLASEEFGNIGEDFAPNEDVFVPIYAAHREHWGAVLMADRMVAKWALPFLSPEDERLFRSGRLIESELRAENLHRPILPGTYYGYSPSVIVSPGHEAASPLLVSSFIDFLERLALRDVLLHGFGTISVTPGGERLCRDLGMTWLCAHVTNREFGVWELAGAAVPDSIFGRKSPVVRRAYAEAFRA